VNLAFQVLHHLSLLLLLLAWLGPAAWMHRDAGRRLNGPRRTVQALGVALALPLAAPVAWALLRPAETLEERRERELTRRLLEQALEPGERCLVCRTELDPRFVCCPTCATEVRKRCSACEEPVELTWLACPYCGHSEEQSRLLRLTAA
jgi:hypothetical protein